MRPLKQSGVQRSLAAFPGAPHACPGGIPSHSPLRILAFEPRFARDFERLNVEWLEKYFAVEPFDRQVFSDPVRYIVEPGGHIIFAQLGDDIVGTCALLNAAIKTFQSLGGSELFLESNTSMSAAMNLYETSGFVRVEGRSHYARSDVYMVYRPEQPEPERQAQSEDSD